MLLSPKLLASEGELAPLGRSKPARGKAKATQSRLEPLLSVGLMLLGPQNNHNNKMQCVLGAPLKE